jgi:hypothetical protein
MSPALRACALALRCCGVATACADDATRSPPPPARTAVTVTPVTMRVDDAPVPVLGSDGRLHVAYEVELSNRSGARVTIDRFETIDAKSGATVASLGADESARRLVVRDAAATPGVLGPSQIGIVYLHLAFDRATAIPAVLEHRVSVTAGSKSIAVTAGRARVLPPTDLVLDAPLRGARFIAGDGCCDSTRHVRASLALDGRMFTAQRFAIDWEQLDAQGRIHAGDPKDPASYVIYGQPAYAVADATVVAAVDQFPDSPIGEFPAGIAVDEADGNHVILDLGGGRHALYAHLKPGSVRVHGGDRVRRGDVLGLVGTSGNSSEPHLHFHVDDAPSGMLSNGLPYRLRQFTSTRRGVSTAAFDRAIVDGQPIPTEPVVGPAERRASLPLDLWIVDFPR